MPIRPPHDLKMSFVEGCEPRQKDLEPLPFMNLVAAAHCSFRKNLAKSKPGFGFKCEGLLLSLLGVVIIAIISLFSSSKLLSCIHISIDASICSNARICICDIVSVFVSMLIFHVCIGMRISSLHMNARVTVDIRDVFLCMDSSICMNRCI